MAITIPDEIWAISHNHPKESLHYMCPITRTRTGEVSSQSKRMQSTGSQWAKQSEDEGEYYENLPITKIVIGDAVTRWSTSNKLFRVTDPRGFTVEVPTGNIAALLHHTTVINGVVQEECIWAREEGSHVILPVNSAPYHQSIKKIAMVDNALKIGDLVPGDRVKMIHNQQILDTEYEYIGSAKLRWIRTITWNSSHFPPQIDAVDDDRWVGLFLIRYRYNGKDYHKVVYETNPKIGARKSGIPTTKVTSDLLNSAVHYYQQTLPGPIYPPNRINKLLPNRTAGGKTNYQVAVLHVKGEN